MNQTASKSKITSRRVFGGSVRPIRKVGSLLLLLVPAVAFAQVDRSPDLPVRSIGIAASLSHYYGTTNELIFLGAGLNLTQVPEVATSGLAFNYVLSAAVQQVLNGVAVDASGIGNDMFVGFGRTWAWLPLDPDAIFFPMVHVSAGAHLSHRFLFDSITTINVLGAGPAVMLLFGNSKVPARATFGFHYSPFISSTATDNAGSFDLGLDEAAGFTGGIQYAF